MVPLEGDTLNSLFDTLADWNDQLKELDAPELTAPKRDRGPEIGP